MSVFWHKGQRASTWWLMLAGLGFVGACANPAADWALYAQNALVGMPKPTLLSCAGVPERQAVADNHEYFTYHSGRIVSYPSLGAYGGTWGPYYGGGWGGAYGADFANIDCEATFTLRNGVVERIVYGGSSGAGASQLGQCYAIVQNCLGQIPQQNLQHTPPPAPK